MHEVFFVASGAGRVKVDGVAHAVEAGSCFVVAPRERHEIENDGEADLILLYFGVAE